MPMQLDEGEIRAPNHSPETVFWRNVIEQAKRDLSIAGKLYGARPDERDRVIAWVGTADFVRVCLNADLEPDAVEKEFRELIEGKKTDE